MKKEKTKKRIKKQVEICPYCGAEIRTGVMSVRAYQYHYDARCLDKRPNF